MRIWREQHMQAERHPAGVTRLSEETPLPVLKTMWGELVPLKKDGPAALFTASKSRPSCNCLSWDSARQNNTQLCGIWEPSRLSTLIISDLRTLAWSLNISVHTAGDFLTLRHIVQSCRSWVCYCGVFVWLWLNSSHAECDLDALKIRMLFFVKHKQAHNMYMSVYLEKH